MSFIEDEHPVGEFGSGREHEPFGVGVRPRATRRDLRGRDPSAGKHRVEGVSELPGPVPDEHLERAGALLWREPAQLAEGDLQIRSYGVLHMRSYPDTGASTACPGCLCRDRVPRYPSDMTAAQWRVLEPHALHTPGPAAQRGGRDVRIFPSVSGFLHWACDRRCRWRRAGQASPRD